VRRRVLPFQIRQFRFSIRRRGHLERLRSNSKNLSQPRFFFNHLVHYRNKNVTDLH
jgi:hypothetical protein